jgi:hypothetical protein
MSVPITIRCECGVETPATMGDHVTCACGREYDTKDVERRGAGTVRALQGRLKFYARLGMLVIVGAAIAGYLVQGLPGAALAAPAAAVLWFRVALPRYKRRVEAQVQELPAWQLQAEPHSDPTP